MKRRPNGAACVGGRRCIAELTIGGKRYCPKHAADELFARKVRESGPCFAVGKLGVTCFGRLQCAHIMRRGYHATRWADDNAVPLCVAHHVWFTEHPLEWEQFCRDRGIDWDGLRLRALNDEPERPEVAVLRLLSVVG